jgi:hypothetical protein
MDLKCFVESCDYTPVFFCECSGYLESMCQSHHSIHLNTKQSVMHNLNPVFKKLTAESEVEIIKYIKDMLKSNEQIKTKLRQNTESLLKTFDHLTKCINNINSCLKSNLNQIIKYRRIFNSSIFVCTQSSELYQGSYKDIKSLVKEIIDLFKICDLEDSVVYYAKRQIYLIQDVLFMGWENLDAEELFYFKQNSKNYINLHLITKALTSEILIQFRFKAILHLYAKLINRNSLFMEDILQIIWLLLI